MRVDIKLITHWNNIGKRVGAQALIAKPNFKSSSIFTDVLVAIQMERLRITYDKPIYIGFCVLELSKHIIYDFYYNFIKNQYQDRVSLLYTDTDSLILHTLTDDFYEDMKQNLSQYDTSNFKPDNPFGIPVSDSIIGKMKDECEGKIIHEFYGTGAKAYVVNVEGQYTKRAKGIQASELTVSDYKDVVENQQTVYKNMNVVTSYLHDIYSELKIKVALSPKDDKRFILPGGSGKTLAWGHYQIPKT